MIRTMKFFQGGSALALALGAATLVPTSAQADPTPECNAGAESGSVECGSNASSASQGGTAVGSSASVGTDTVLGTAVGASSIAGGPGSLAIGGGAIAQDASQAGITFFSVNDISAAATAVGTMSRVSGDGGVAVGVQAVVGVRDEGTIVNQGTSIGANSLVSADGGSALGSGATVAAGATDAVAIGSGSVADQAGTVSFGTAGAERRVVNMADGIAASDGATVGQMQVADAAVLNDANAYTDDRESAVRSDMEAGDAATLAGAQSYADLGDAQTLSLAQAYADSGDARTLDQANRYTDERVQGLRTDFYRQLDRAMAGATALSGIPQSVVPGKGMIGVAVGGRGDTIAFAIGASKVTSKGFAFKTGAAFHPRGGKVTYQAGMGWAF